jgi:hypothetical protein
VLGKVDGWVMVVERLAEVFDGLESVSILGHVNSKQQSANLMVIFHSEPLDTLPDCLSQSLLGHFMLRCVVEGMEQDAELQIVEVRVLNIGFEC